MSKEEKQMNALSDDELMAAAGGRFLTENHLLYNSIPQIAIEMRERKKMFEKIKPNNKS